ncbi:MAG: hypothetical protein FJ296_00700 [Planctomycetes bacterium]|nr:hypothetical protein [Planctomycetota bacterium]
MYDHVATGVYVDAPPNPPGARPPRQAMQAEPMGPRDMSRGVRWKLGRDLQGNYAPTAHIRDSQGRSQRLYNPQEIEQAGGYTPGTAASSGAAGFIDQAGQPLGAIEDMVDELNRRSPYQRAWIDRGAIRMERVPVRARPTPGDIVNLGRIEQAKELNREQSFAGMEASYRQALASGQTQLARQIAERMYHRGSSPQTLRAIQQEVAGEAEALNPMAGLPDAQTIMAIKQHLESNRDPQAWLMAAMDVEAAGFPSVAKDIRAAAAQLGIQGRHDENLADRAVGRSEVQARHDEEQAQQQTEFAYRQQQDAADAVRADEHLRIAQEGLDFRRAEAFTQLQKDAIAVRAKETDAQRRGIDQRIGRLISGLRGYRMHLENDMSGAGPSKAGLREIVTGALLENFSDSPELYKLVMGAYDSLVKTGADAITAAEMAVSAVTGKAMAPLGAAPEGEALDEESGEPEGDLGDEDLPAEERLELENA